MSDTANDVYLDAALRHAVNVRRLTASEVKNVLAILEKADQELSVKLRLQLSKLAGKPIDFRGQRIKALLTDVRVARTAVMKQIKVMLKETLINVAKEEEEMERRVLAASLPISVQLATVDVPTLRALVTSVPFAAGAGQSRMLSQWFDGLSQADQRRLIGTIQQGLAQGETVGQLMARVAGTRSRGYQDGVLAVSRRNAEAIVRTAVSHVSNAAREAVWQENADIIDALRWVSTLDGRTTAVCRARDGRMAPIGNKPIPKGWKRLDPPGARPPAHVQCRSVMVAVLSIDGAAQIIGTRPYVRDVRTGMTRKKNFYLEAKERAGSRWKSMTRKQREAAGRRLAREWAAESIGQVPASVTYQEWLKRQPAKFQDEVLGRTRGRLFRRGGLTVDKFVDRNGGELTLEELAKTNPEAFIAAGVDLEKL